MQILDLIQGTPEWHAHRATHFNASDAPAMMGVSKFKTRAQLLHEMHTGITPEVDAGTQARYNEGHRYEALARPLAEEFTGQEFFPVVGSEGKLSASFDGLTMSEDLIFEHKTLNKDLQAIMVDGCTGADLPLMYRVQMEQQCMVSGAPRVLFMASSWSGSTLVEERHCYYEADRTMSDAIMQGWAQFATDLDVYALPAPAEPELVGRTPETLPALHIVLKGEVSASNLAEFKEVALAAIRSVNRDLKTDQDFADSAKARKWCEDIEARVAGAKEHALSQTSTIDLLFRTMDEISAEAREVRLALEKLEKARKESRRGEIVAGGLAALRDHIAALHKRTEGVMPYPTTVDFGAAIKGLRTFDSMQNAVDTTLANAKIAASATADRIQANLTTLREQATEFKFLFPDTQVIVQKAPDDFASLVKARIAEHRAAEAKKEEEQRERIRQEELRRIEREQQAAERQRVADQAAATAKAAQPVAAPIVVAAQVAASAPAVIALPRRVEPAAATHPTLSLGAIKERIAPLSLTADGMATLGFVGLKERGAVLYHEADFPHICAAIVQHIESLQAKQAA